MATQINPYAETARLAKIVKLTLAASKIGMDSQQMAQISDLQWAALELVAGCKPASDETRAACIESLRASEQRRHATVAFPNYQHD